MKKLALSQIGEIYYDILRHARIDIYVNGQEDTVITIMQKVFLFVCMVGIGGAFSVLHVTTYDESDKFEEKAMHWAIFCNMMSVLLRFIRVISKKNLFRSLFIDFEKMNCNQHRNDYAREVLTKSVELCKKIDYCFTYFMFSVYFVWLLAPTILSPFMLVFSNEEITYNKLILKLPSTYQFNVSSPLREIRYVFESVNSCLALALWQSLDLTFFVIVFMIQAQFDVVCDSVRTRHDPTSKDNHDPLPLKKVVQDHVTLIRISRNLKELLSPLLMVQLLQGVIVIGCLGYSTTTSPPWQAAGVVDILQNTAQFATFLGLALSQLLMYCWLSQVTNESNQKIATAIYDTSEWYKNLHGKRDFVFPILMSHRDMSFTALNMVVINLFSFLDVVRLSYSYFTMLKQFAKGGE